jgi:hypothetical protein
LIIKPGSNLKRKDVIGKLQESNIDCRTIVAGNFTRNEVMKCFDYEAHQELKKSDYLHENRIFAKGFVIIIAIYGSGYVGLSDIIPIQKKHDVSGLFYENITRMSLVEVIIVFKRLSLLKKSESFSDQNRGGVMMPVYNFL